MTTSTPQDDIESDRRTNLLTAIKLVAASALFYSAGSSFAQTYHQLKHDDTSSATIPPSPRTNDAATTDNNSAPTNNAYQIRILSRKEEDDRSIDNSHRRLSSADPPSYMTHLFADLKARKKLMEETPPEEVKYWFEYTGPLQVRIFLLLYCCCFYMLSCAHDVVFIWTVLLFVCSL